MWRNNKSTYTLDIRLCNTHTILKIALKCCSHANLLTKGTTVSDLLALSTNTELPKLHSKSMHVLR